MILLGRIDRSKKLVLTFKLLNIGECKFSMPTRSSYTPQLAVICPSFNGSFAHIKDS